MHKAAQNGKSYKMPHIDGTSPEEKKTKNKNDNRHPQLTNQTPLRNWQAQQTKKQLNDLNNRSSQMTGLGSK